MAHTEAYLELCKAQVRVVNRDRVPDRRTLTVIANSIGQAVVDEELEASQLAEGV